MTSYDEAAWQALFESAVDAIVWIDERGTILRANSATTDLFGYTSDELIGENVSVLMPEPHRDAHDDYLARYHETGVAKIIGKGRRVEGQRKDGSCFPLYLSVGEGETQGGRVYTGILHDVSEESALQEQLLQAQKMEALGTLAGGVAHDFNNLLTSIRGSIDLIISGLEPDHKLQRSANRVLEAAKRGAELTTHLLALSRKESPNPQPVDLPAALREAQELFGRMIGEHVKISLHVDGDVPPVRIDPTQLHQLIANLLVNGADAMPKGGTLAIHVRRAELTRGDAGLGLEPGRYVHLDVTDEGTGIAPDALPHIFEPFFTTKPRGQGTGLGLSTVYSIVRQAGGGIAVESELGRGTRFRLYLPEASAS